MKHNTMIRSAACVMSFIPALSGTGTFTVSAQTAEVAAPVFSQESGFYDDAFDLTLSVPDNCLIYYTLDGSEPDKYSLRYEAPITVYDRTPEANVCSALAMPYNPPKDPVRKATVIRAAACDAAGNFSQAVTKTYFIGYEQSDYLMQMPVISLVTDPDHLFDEETGIYTDNGVFQRWMENGREWERPASMTVFEQGKACYNADIGIRTHGNSSCTFPQKSFKLYSRKEYGTKKFEYDFFHGTAKNTEGESIVSFNHIILRNGGNDNILKIRDRLNQEMAAGRSFGTQEMTESIVFIDGEYWGLYNITEKLNESYVAAHYGVKKDSVILIKDSLNFIDENTKGLNDYKKLVALGEAGLSGADAYDRLAAIVDMKSFEEYMAAELIIANDDFNDNNIGLWKTDTVDSSNPYADGKWRFLMFDTEMTASEPDNDPIRWTHDSCVWNYNLLHSMLDNSPRFRREFAEAYNSLCDENFNSERVLKRLDELWLAYREPLTETYDLFTLSYATDPADTAMNWEYKQLRSYWESRAEYAKANLASYLRTLTVSGDVNGDSRTDQEDAELLRDWLLSKPDADPPALQAADLHSDGVLNAKDLTLLKRTVLAE